MNPIFYGGTPGNPTYYTVGTNGQYNQISDPSNTPLGNLGAMGAQAIQQGQVQPLPQGAITIPVGAVVGNAVGGVSGTPSGTGVASTLGGNIPQVPTPPAAVDSSSQYAGIISGLQTAGQQQQSALQQQEQASVSQLKQSQSGETAGYAQTAATLQGIGGISTLWTNFFSNLNEAHQTTMDNLKAQYDSAIASANGNLANQIATIQSQAIQANQQQQQQFFSNAMSVFNAQVGLVNQQVTQSQGQQQLDLAKQNQTFQQQQAKLTNFQNQFNAIIPTLEGQGWGSLSPEQQQQITQLSEGAGIPGAIVQSLVNTKSVAGTATATDLFGNSKVLMYDKHGNVLRSINMGGGVDPNSAAGQSILGGFTVQGPNTGAQFVNKSTLPSGAEQGAILNWAAQKGIPILSGTDAVAVTKMDAAVGQIADIKNKIQNDYTQLAVNSPELVSGWAGRSLDEALQITGNSSDPTAKDLHNSLALLESLNVELINPIKQAAGFGNGGIGFNALINTADSVLINKDQTVPTILGHLDNLNDSINLSLKSYGFKNLTGGTTSGGSSDVTSFLSTLGLHGNSGSTSNF